MLICLEEQEGRGTSTCAQGTAFPHQALPPSITCNSSKDPPSLLPPSSICLRPGSILFHLLFPRQNRQAWAFDIRYLHAARLITPTLLSPHCLPTRLWIEQGLRTFLRDTWMSGGELFKKKTGIVAVCARFARCALRTFYFIFFYYAYCLTSLLLTIFLYPSLYTTKAS